VLAICAEKERCDVLDFANQLRRDDPRESARLLRAFARGPYLNDKRRGALQITEDA
jgi:hypothetical protein